MSGQILHMAKVNLSIGGDSEVILLYVTRLAYFDIVLGLPWLQYHDPEIRWAEETLQFKDQICDNHITKPLQLIHALSPKDVRMRRETYSVQSLDLKNNIEICDPETFSDSVIRGNDIVMAVSMEDIKEALKEKPKVDPAEKQPEIYHEYLPVFSTLR